MAVFFLCAWIGLGAGLAPTLLPTLLLSGCLNARDIYTLLWQELPSIEAGPGVLAGGAALFLAQPRAGDRCLPGGQWAQGAEGDAVHMTVRFATPETLFRHAITVWVDASSPAGPRTAPVLVGCRRLSLPMVVRTPKDVSSFEVQGPFLRSVLALRYTRVDERPAPVVAGWDGIEATVEVSGTGGTVIDPPNQACATRSGGSSPSMGLLSVLLGLVGLRRRGALASSRQRSSSCFTAIGCLWAAKRR